MLFRDFVSINKTKKLNSEVYLQYKEDFYKSNDKYRKRTLIGMLILSLIFGLNQGGTVDGPNPTFYLLLKIHYFVNIPILTGVVVFSFINKSYFWSEVLMAVAVSITGIIYIVMEGIAPTPLGSEASQTTVVLLIIIMASCTALRLRLATSLFCTWFLFFVYTFLGLFIYRMENGLWNILSTLLGCCVASIGAMVVDRGTKNIFWSKYCTDYLLKTILPDSIAYRLNEGENPIFDRYEMVTVLFADIKDFTKLAANVAEKELVVFLNYVFLGFDELVHKYELEKIKTIGDAYMVVGGIPIANSEHAVSIARLALEMLDFSRTIIKPDGEPLEIRIGIHSGPIVAGVIGEKKISYDLWGDTVNLASRMESLGEEDKIQVSGDSFMLLKDKFEFERRGILDVGERCFETYWLLNETNNSVELITSVQSSDD